MNLLVKVCGMTDGENIRRVEELGVDFIGFVFYPRSPRFVYQMPDYLPRRARRIGVFVNETKETVLTYSDRFGLDYVQLHGNESPLYCQSLREGHGLKVVKAFHLATPRDVADDYLFDGLPRRLAVGRYHSWVVSRESLPDTLAVTAVSDEGLIMGLRHRKLDVHGIQFHPESVLTPLGERIIRNWTEHAS